MALQSRLGVRDSILVGSTMAAGMGTGDPLNQSITQPLGIVDTIGRFENPAQPLVLVQDIQFELLIDDIKNVVQVLGLTQDAQPGTFQDITQNLGLSQLVDPLLFGPVVQNLWLADAATFVGPRYVTVSDPITFSQNALAQFDVPVTVIQNLGITDLAQDVQKHELNLTQSVFGFLNADPHFKQALGLIQTVQNNLEYVISLTDPNVVADAVAFWIDDGTSCPKNQYNDFGTLGEIPFTVASGAKLAFKSIAGNEDIVFLRNPELDDRDRLGYTRVNRESRGGELQVYRDPVWPQVNTVQGTIIGLKKTDVDDLLQFFEDHLGEEISMNDWHGRYWRGIILNPGEAMVEDTRNRWTVAFEFEGIEMPGPDVFQQIGINDTMVHNVDYTRSLTDNLGLQQTVDPGLQNVHYEASTPNNVILGVGNEVFYSG